MTTVHTESIIDIPVLTDADGMAPEEDVLIEVEDIRAVPGHFGDDYRRC